jgi:lantibiotic modifying enzyme
LIASITRQWIDSTREFILRLDSDLGTICRDIIRLDGDSKVAEVEGDFSDPHNGGRSVLVVTFKNGPVSSTSRRICASTSFGLSWSSV